MTRNTEKRVEVACPVYDEAVKRRLLHQLKVMLADNVKAREMAEDGTYHKKAESGRKINAQETFMQEALHAKKEETREMREQKNTGSLTPQYEEAAEPFSEYLQTGRSVPPSYHPFLPPL